MSLRHHRSAWLLPAAILILALLPWPYGYYTFLRLAVFLVAIWFAYEQWKLDDSVSGWVVALGATALLYNPILPVHLNREIWGALNIASAAIFLAHLASLRRMIIAPEGPEREERGLPAQPTVATRRHPRKRPE